MILMLPNVCNFIELITFAESHRDLYGIIYGQSQTQKGAIRESTEGFELWQDIKNETIWTCSSIES